MDQVFCLMDSTEVWESAKWFDRQKPSDWNYPIISLNFSGKKVSGIYFRCFLDE